MRKYQPLGEYLRKQNRPELPMTFSEVERVLGAKLPKSAHDYRPWWSNNASNSVMTQEWLDAGYRAARVDMKAKKLVFQRVTNETARRGHGMGEPASAFQHEINTGSKSHPLVGALKGTFTLEIDYDLTQPAMQEWADLIDAKYRSEESK